jgi:GNAT superfamily N-acetyltransferase
VGTGGVRPRGRRADDIRELTAADEALAPELAALHKQAHAAGMALGRLAAEPAELEPEHREFIRGVGEDTALVVAEQAGAVTGMAQVVRSGAENARHRAEVRRVAVADDARGRGVGRALMEAVEHAARRRGITLLWLTTHDASDAASFYESIGYVRMGTMPSYSANPDGELMPAAFFYRELT